MFESAEEKITYPNIAQELLEMRQLDQEVHKPSPDGSVNKERWDEVESANNAKLKKIITEIGWPTLSKVGKQASETAWLIAQHADRDIPFQKQCLELMSAEPETEVSEIDIAYLHDRICVNEKRPQCYGTQFYDNEYGAYGPRPIEDPENVDERRATIGLDTMEEYKKRLERKYEE